MAILDEEIGMWHDPLDHYVHNKSYLSLRNPIFQINTIIAYLLAKPNITKIELAYGIIRSGGIENLSKCTSVKTLIINANPKNIDKLNFLNQIVVNPNLEIVYLEGCKIGDDGLTTLSSSKHLQELYVANCGISDKGAQAIASNSSLNKLHITDNNITDTGAEFLVSNTSIRILDLSHNPITSIDVIDRLKAGARTVTSDGIPRTIYDPR